MAITSPFLCCVTIVLHFLVLFQSTKAVQHDRDRAILSYNSATDPCRHIKSSSHEEEKDAANWACKEAFHALDRINANTCHGWRRPKCRSFHNSPHKLCSCKISTCKLFGIRSDETKSFGECALEFWTEELYAGKVLPSERYQETLKRVEDSALQAVRAAKAAKAAKARFSETFNEGGASGGGKSHPETTSHGPVRKRKRYYRYDPVHPEGTAARNALKPFVCDTCGHHYSSRTTLGQHKKSHTTQSTICTICNIIYSTTSSYQNHFRNKHINPPKAAPARVEEVEFGPYLCDVCGRTYQTPASFRNHKKCHVLDLRCKICNKPFLAKTNFDVHIRQVHPGHEAVAAGATSTNNPEVVEAYNASKPNACDKCGNRYVTKESLRQHMRSHNSEAATCHLCNRIFSAPYSYRSHLKLVHKKDSLPPPGGSSGHKD